MHSCCGGHFAGQQAYHTHSYKICLLPLHSCSSPPPHRALQQAALIPASIKCAPAGNPCEVNAPEIMEKIRACLTRNQAQAGFGDGANSQSESVSNASLATSSTLYPHASATSWTSKDGGPARDQSPPRRVLQTGNPESCSIGK